MRFFLSSESYSSNLRGMGRNTKRRFSWDFQIGFAAIVEDLLAEDGMDNAIYNFVIMDLDP